MRGVNNNSLWQEDKPNDVNNNSVWQEDKPNDVNNNSLWQEDKPNDVNPKEFARIGYNGFPFPHSYSGDGRGAKGDGLGATHLGFYLSTHAEKETRYIQSASFVSIVLYLILKSVIILNEISFVINTVYANKKSGFSMKHPLQINIEIK